MLFLKCHEQKVCMRMPYAYIHYNPCFVISKCVYGYVHIHTYGCFRKWWYPQIIHFNRVFHYKPSILGYPYFRKHPYVHINIITGPWCFGLRKRTFGLHDAATAKVCELQGDVVVNFYPWNSGQFVHYCDAVFCLLVFAVFAIRCCLLPWIVPHMWGIGFAFWRDFKQKEVLRKETVSIGPHQKRGPTLGWCRKPSRGEHKFQKRFEVGSLRFPVETRDNFTD